MNTPIDRRFHVVANHDVVSRITDVTITLEIPSNLLIRDDEIRWVSEPPGDEVRTQLESVAAHLSKLAAQQPWGHRQMLGSSTQLATHR